MCTAAVAQIILDVIEEKTKGQEVFTAYDVTVAARSKANDYISHNDVRRIVQKEFNSGEFPAEYQSEFIELNVPGNPQAMVFFPDGKSAYDHPKAVQNSAPQNTTPDPFVPFSGTTSSSPTTNRLGGHVKNGDEVLCSKTKEGRINIPKSILNEMFPLNGGTFDIVVSGKVHYKKANEDGRVRVGPDILSMAGDGYTYRVKANHQNDTIEISLA